MQMKHLRRSRQLLEKLNLKLSEANRIKNSYIGHYLDATFKLVNQLDNFVLVGQQKLDSKQYDSLSSMIHNLNSDFNRKSAFADFDRTFCLCSRHSSRASIHCFNQMISLFWKIKVH